MGGNAGVCGVLVARGGKCPSAEQGDEHRCSGTYGQDERPAGVCLGGEDLGPEHSIYVFVLCLPATAWKNHKGKGPGVSHAFGYPCAQHVVLDKPCRMLSVGISVICGSL